MDELSGRGIGFPLVAKLAALRHHKSYHIPWHQHKMPELQYVLSGALTYEFRNIQPITIPGGSFFIVPAGLEHRAADDAGAPSTRLGIQFNPPVATAVTRTPFTTKELTAVFERFAACTVQPRRQTAEGARVAHTLFGLIRSDSTVESQVKIRHLVNAILIETDTALKMPERHADTTVQEMKRWIEAHCTENLHIPDLVRMSGYSRTRLFSLFASAAGMSPNDWLIRCRIEKARQMLATGKGTVTDIALSCGFSSPAYFTATFRRYTGRPPREFMRVKK
ncbi:MAG: helix-turn-helix domain-containing protein [Kiritimatiellae bacterium]|nr:helix-turn-helix domain-containing protein [Kiritimatiellia bacterium]